MRTSGQAKELHAFAAGFVLSSMYFVFMLLLMPRV